MTLVPRTLSKKYPKTRIQNFKSLNLIQLTRLIGAFWSLFVFVTVKVFPTPDGLSCPTEICVDMSDVENVMWPRFKGVKIANGELSKFIPPLETCEFTGVIVLPCDGVGAVVPTAGDISNESTGNGELSDVF